MMMKQKRSLVYIGQEQHIVTQAVENRLTEAGFDVLALPSDIDEINKNRHNTDIFLCYLDYTNPKTEIVMHYLADLCRDEYKSMCLIVDNATRAQVKKMDSAHWAAHTYVRPLDMNDIAEDLVELSEAHDEFRRKKTLLVVDDDSDFLMIMNYWMKGHYNIVGVNSGVEAVTYLQHHATPDLILLDYEMPDLDGYDVMQWLHGTPQTAGIPIIFLTGVNDRESVMRVVKHKPDGYLLKSSRKSELLDALERFFVETIFHQHTKKS
ncbi:MAG: response regulator [Schwartzia sp.]|nr:response regulator [Schwartzia sp. (in: firmicutes)]